MIQPHIGGVLPHPRAGMTLTALRGRLFLFGGSGTSSKCFQDLQILDRAEMAWLDVTATQFENPNRSNNNHRNNNNLMGGFRDPHDALLGDDDYNRRWRFGGNPAGMMEHVANNNDIVAAQEGGMQAGNHRFQFGGVGGGGGGPANQNLAGGMQDGGNVGGPVGGQGNPLSVDGFNSGVQTDWRSRDYGLQLGRARGNGIMPMSTGGANPNDEDTVPTVLVHGRGPGRRAGHTATAVGRNIYVFGGSCGSEYLNDFFVLDTDPPPHACVSEPTSLQLLEGRLRHFFNQEEFSDVTFLVQGQKVYGHKMVLSIVSDCFRAMFTTGFRESDVNEIEIPDCSHEAFLAVMEYIYTGQTPKMDNSVNVNAATAATAGAAGPGGDTIRDVNLSRVVEILELADRFFLDHLKQICETMLQPAVNAETVEFLLPVAQKTNAGQLQTICEHFIRNQQES